MSESKPVTAPGVDIEVRKEKRSADGWRVWLRLPELHRDLAMYSFVLTQPGAEKLAAGLRERLQSQPSGWGPIAEYDRKRDGELVLLFDHPKHADYDYAVCVGFWDGDMWRAEHGRVSPTHFQLLPPPPREQP